MRGKTDASLVEKSLATSDAPHLDTKALIQKLDEVAKTVHLDVSTIVTGQSKDPVLGTVRFWIRKNTPTILNHQRSNSLKVSYDIVKNSTDFLLKKKNSAFATMNHRTSWKRRIFVYVSLYLYSLHVSDWGTITKWVGTWEQLTFVPMPKDSTTGPDCLIGHMPNG